MRAATGLCAAVAAALLATAAASARGVNVGVNYLWWKFTLVGASECKEQGEPRTSGVWFLPSYDNARVRRTVRAQLVAMRAAGFTTLRTVVIYSHSPDPDPTAFTSTNGDLSPGDRAKIARYVADVAASGFKTLELAPDFGDTNWLYCRRRAWGDCFDPSRTGENWRFISQVARAADGAKGPLALRFDLANEQAPDPSMRPATLARARAYLTTLARRFEAAFGREWTISAARSNSSPATETGARLGLLLSDLAAAGIVPKYLEVHTYSNDGNDVVETLDEAQRLAQSVGARLILGEIRYHSDAQVDAIEAWLRKTPDSRLADVIEWPEYDPSTPCEVNPEPPYTPGALGRLANPERR